MTHVQELWGILFYALRDLHEQPFLISKTWRGYVLPHYDGEAGRLLLFRTRRHAHAWAKEENARFRAYPHGHPCRLWRFRVVRVCERVTVQSSGH